VKTRWLAAAAAALLLPGTALADTLIDDIAGISVDRNGTVTRFAAMVIDDDGRIAEILQAGQRPARPVEFREDGRGRTVMPGIVDSHVHLMELGLARLTLDLSGATTLAEAQSRITAYAAANPERPWIVGRGWNEDAWRLGRYPTAAELDLAEGDRPVWLVRSDGQAGWANSTALNLAQVTDTTAEPLGGRIVRDVTGRAPAGVLIGAAMDLVGSKVPPPRAADRELALHEAQNLLLERGVTAVADMGTSLEDWMTFRRAGDANRLRLRIAAYAASVPEMVLIGGSGPTPWLYDDHLRLGGLHLVLDRTLGSRGARLKAPYADDPGQTGLERLNGTQLRNNMSRAAMEGYQVAIHAAGDAASAEALSAIEELVADYTGDRRWRIEHARVVDPADIGRFGQHGIIASLQPVAEDPEVAARRLGSERLDRLSPWQAIASAGAPLVFGSDSPLGRVEPLAAIAAVSGIVDGPAIGRGQALAAHTAAAAHALFGEGRFGRLAPGEYADFIVLDADPLQMDAGRLDRIRVLETWIGGIKLYDAQAGSRGRSAEAPGR
jgi:predicted amidohydrolase YtcJ